MALEKYKAKRKFKETPEPAAAKKAGKGDYPVFVIQKHAARHLHYDFRLEAGGVLKSWAVPKGLPAKPGEKRLAMMVEDHPYEYKNFEGIIPPGNYGAGTVIIWDKGYYANGAQEKKAIEKEIENGIKVGSFHFILSGSKVSGEFILVKFKKAADNSWLLINKNGKIMPSEKSAKSGKTIAEISSVKTQISMKIRDSLREAPERKFPGFLNPMLAKSAEAPFNDADWIFEIKWDGYRALAFLNGGRCELKSRNNKNYNLKFSKIYESLKKIKGADVVLDGEIVALDSYGHARFQWLQDYEISPHGFLSYEVFDILYLDGKSLTGLPLIKRKNILKKVLPDLENIRYCDHILEKGKDFYRQAVKRGLEGIMAKRIGSTYQAGKRSGDWLKIRAEKRQEAVIAGYTEPRGGRKHFGSLLLGAYMKEKFIYIGNSGGGFDEESLKKIKSRLEEIEIGQCPFERIPKTNAPAHWVKPNLVAEIKFTEWTKDRVMRHPIFMGLREDKSPKEIKIN